MLKKTTISIFVVLIAFIANGQSSKDLSELLWGQVGDCYSESEEELEEYFDIVDDSGNGYLEITGGFPPGGCGCVEEVGAFKNNDGTYTIINQEFWDCEWTDLIISNRNIEEVFPLDFGIETFMPNVNIPFQKRAMFYVNVEVPRVGTDMKVAIHPIPFGMTIEGDNGFSFGYKEAVDYSNCKYVSSIRILFNGKYSAKAIANIIAKKYEDLSEDCINLMDGTLGEDMPFLLDSYDEFSNHLKLVKLTYDYYSQIEYDYVILAWNVSESRFYIKEKHKIEEKYNFPEFVGYSNFWSPVF